MSSSKTTKLLSLLMILGLAITSCSKSSDPTKIEEPAVSAPDLSGPEIRPGDLKPGEARPVILSNGSEIIVQRHGDKLLHLIEGTFTTQAFSSLLSSWAEKPKAERDALLALEIDAVFAKAKRIGGLAGDTVAPVGYFQMMIPYESQIFRALKTLNFEKSITVQPLIREKEELKRIRTLSPIDKDAIARRDGRQGKSSYSGLERIGALDFVQQAESDIGGGVKVDGSSVQVGITDTGITYNHPTFLSASSGKNRINYMTDTTGEGTIYINSKASLSAAAVEGSSEDLVVEAQVIVTPKLPAAPAGDAVQTVKGLKIKVSAELRALLLAPNASGAKLGLIQEDVVGSEDEAVDLNHNGKINDKLLLIYLPAQEGISERVYFDASATGDFRKSTALEDFNHSKKTVAVFAERIGFSFTDAKLPNSEGSDTVGVRAISLVGFDPGNHGSHVAGISSGRKIIANDRDDTLARGVAPESKIAMNRVCSNNAGCSGSRAIAELAAHAGVEVINMSLGGLSPFNDGAGVQETLVNRLTSVNNVVFMISAGNSGPGRQTVGSPSVARLSLSIGASASRSLIERQYQWPGQGTSPAVSADDDFMLFFSSRGPSASGGFKPTLSAPGTELSAIQFNSAPGMRGGLDVYWGTSMAAPTATGAFALLLDAIKKYNERHESKLTTDALMLRNILIETARPFDANRLDLTTGEHTDGQYIWSDQGVGMIHLSAAWKKLFQVRDSMPASAVSRNGKSVELDYEVLTSAKAPNGNDYDGSRVENGRPVFASGLYLSTQDADTFKSVHIARRLPESLASGVDAGELTAQLLSTADDFVLRTVIYGSNVAWLKAGVFETPNCQSSPSADITVLASGAELAVKEGKGSLTSIGASGLNICIDKEKASSLSSGDHGALIYAYRKVGDQVAPIASFIVPVYLNVPHRVLANSTALEHSGAINAFGVDRHYAMVPPGTSVLRITMEVPPIKVDSRGFVPADELCSGVELMAYEGGNTAKAIADRSKARVSNCTLGGTATNEIGKRQLVVTRTNPKAGLWDIHVFGQYRNARSKYQLRVDFVAGEASLKAIEGGLAALTGSLHWTLKDASIAALPDSGKSKIEISGLENSVESKVAAKASVFVESGLGVLRSYPADLKSVVITTGGSPGNDIDLAVLACPADAQTPEDSRCEEAGSSGGATDVEKVEFTVKTGMKYAVRVDGFEVKDEGKFTSVETLTFKPETGAVQITGSAPTFGVTYSFAAESSALLKQPLFDGGKYKAVGSLSIRMADDTILSAIPVKIENK